MKKLLVLSVFALGFLVSWVYADKGYIDLDFKKLKLAPENYNGKKIVYTAQFLKFSTAFEGYMEESGFSGEKHIRCVFGGPAVPVIMTKTAAMTKFVGDLKRGQKVKIYGVVKKFTAEPATSVLPSYYVKVDHVELAQTQNEPEEKDEPAAPRKRRWRRLWR
jgi:hypothetical protein